jgi:serine/threonine protein kinase
MGQVWKARDTRLGRLVAIKVAAAEFSERFAREARAIAALNHPNICTLHDVGPDYLVMEYVDGSALNGPMPTDRAIAVAIQLTDALVAAHRAGVTHRDLKPANILLTKSGVKVLDFGLAKVESATEFISSDDTREQFLTQQGAVVGTLPYMAPEQVQGRQTDARTDIFAFGCVLYEMLTGTRAFGGDNSALVLAAILNHQPVLPAGLVPPSLDWVLQRCLAKDPDDRWQSARDLRAALQRASDYVPALPSHAQGRSGRLLWAAGASVALLAATLAGGVFRRPTPLEPVRRLSLVAPDGTRFNLATPPAVSPDGSRVIFSATTSEGTTQLWLRSLDSLAAQPLPGTENAIYPFWSPDTRSIGFFSAGKLKTMEASGGPVTAIADAQTGRGAAWSRDGVIVFAPSIYSGLYQVAASGGMVRPALRFEARMPAQKFPSFLPDGRHFLYMSGAGGREQQNIKLGSLDSPADDSTVAAGVDTAAVYAQGHVLFVRGTTLVALPFDVDNLRPSGPEFTVAEGLLTGGVPAQSWVFSATTNVLVYQVGVTSAARLTWLSRAGTPVGTVGEPGDLGGVRLAASGRMAASSLTNHDRNNDVWVFDLSRGVRTRLTSSPGDDSNMVWSPDGRVVVFASNRSGRYDLYRVSSDGSSRDQLIYADNLLKLPTSLSPDGMLLAYSVTSDPTTGSDIWILPRPLDGSSDRKPYPFIRTTFNEGAAEFSPDGRWLAYESNESGRVEIYVTPFPGPGARTRVSVSGGSQPRWRADTRELFYRGADRSQMAAAIDAGSSTFRVTKTSQLFSAVDPGGYGVSADGQRFLVASPVGGEAGKPLTVVQRWVAGINKE